MHFRSWETLLARGLHAFSWTPLHLTFILPKQVYMAKVLGSDLRPFVHDLHFDEWALHSHVLHPQAGTLQRKQGPGAARVRRPRVQIYPLKRINMIEGSTAWIFAS